MAPPKAKGQKMGLGEFLTDTSLGSWADEMEDAPVPSGGRSGSGYGGDRSYNSSGGASGTYADRGYSVREVLPLPSKPPYTVHLGNMSFDATEGDVQDFFAACEITSVRIVEDKLDRKPKGFGYAEFASLDGLKKALEFNGAQFQGRNIRVSVAEPQKDRPDAREFGDWTRKGPLPDLAQTRSSDRSVHSATRNFDDVSDRTNRRQPFEQNDNKVRDFGNWERKGPINPSPSHPAPTARHLDPPSSNEHPRERRNSPAWGEGRSQDGSRPPRRDFVDRPAPERAPTAAETDNQWRSKMRPDPSLPPVTTSPTAPNKDASTPSSPSPSQPPSLNTRPKLNLQKRTVSNAEPMLPAAASLSDSKASPFGAARPIDTTARDKEIEDKLKQKKAQDEKSREEKRHADEKVKDDRRIPKGMEKADKAKDKTNEEKEGSEQTEPQATNYRILRRDTAIDEDHPPTTVHKIDGTNGFNSEHAVEHSPSEDMVNGAESAEDLAADNEDNEGWSTVSKSQKSRKGPNTSSRSIPS